MPERLRNIGEPPPVHDEEDFDSEEFDQMVPDVKEINKLNAPPDLSVLIVKKDQGWANGRA